MNIVTSELLVLNRGHHAAVAALQARCVHPEKAIKIRLDGECVGKGSSSPSVHVTCRNCGKKKIIFRRSEAELKTKVQKILTRQGFKDERLDCAIQYEWELE